jgi:hypothetical protein
MRERGIIFSAPMVRALLAGAKTQTRRVLNPQPAPEAAAINPVSRYGTVGDRLRVREAFRIDGFTSRPSVVYRADADDPRVRWRSPIHMPRWASRITLVIEAVRVERLQAIDDADASAEGFPPPLPRTEFHATWLSLHGTSAWNDNPWVWVLTFRRHEA